MCCGAKSHKIGPLRSDEACQREIRRKYGYQKLNQTPHDPTQRVACAVLLYQILLTTNWHKTWNTLSTNPDVEHNACDKEVVSHPTTLEPHAHTRPQTFTTAVKSRTLGRFET